MNQLADCSAGKMCDLAVGDVAKGVKAISRSQSNGGFGTDSGRCRGDSCRGAFRPLLPFKISSVNGREAQIAAISRGCAEWVKSTPERPFAVGPMNRRCAPDCGRRLNGTIAPEPVLAALKEAMGHT